MKNDSCRNDCVCVQAFVRLYAFPRFSVGDDFFFLHLIGTSCLMHLAKRTISMFNCAKRAMEQEKKRSNTRWLNNIRFIFNTHSSLYKRFTHAANYAKPERKKTLSRWQFRQSIIVRPHRVAPFTPRLTQTHISVSFGRKFTIYEHAINSPFNTQQIKRQNNNKQRWNC